MTTDDPCDDVSHWIWVEWIPVMNAAMRTTHDAFAKLIGVDFASGGTINTPGKGEPMRIMGTIGPEAIMPRRRYGKSLIPQMLRCLHDQHDWTVWGDFIPAPLKPLEPIRSCDVPPEPSKIEAYRWRHCQCGAAEREAWHDHTVKHFNPGEKR